MQRICKEIKSFIGKLCTWKLRMNAKEFVKLWKSEINSIISSYQDKNEQTVVSELIQKLGLTPNQEDAFWEIAKIMLDETAYTFLLGLDGCAQLGGEQQHFKLYDERGVLISSSGDIEAAAYEAFFEKRT
ncbi:hypothetical protein [Alteromonas mediterranea]|uniref:hypothetical protein n=2 Tax=Alteromonas mediterranea TaxID=314275 RepID=UPI001AD82ED6|nr:hypothetical protein [Alteromonas mediterranea]